MKKLTPGELPLASGKSPDDVCRIAVRASLAPRRGKSISEIAKLCDLGMNTVRRHLKNLIKVGYAKQIGSGRGTKYLSSRLGRSARREIQAPNLTDEQADRLADGARESMMKLINRWRRGRGLPPR